MNILLFALLSLVVYRYLGWVLGAPFMTPDSREYLNMAQVPWSGFGGHFPTAFPWAVYLTGKLGLGPEYAIALLSTIKATCVYAILRRVYRSHWALIPALAFCLWPEMLALDFAAWSESGFITTGVAIALILCGTRGAVAVGFGSALLFIIMAEFRHAAVFFAPGLALGLGAYWYARVPQGLSMLRRVILAFGASFLLIGVSWTALNYVRTGHALAPSTAQFECVHFLAAYSQIPFCDRIPDNPLCVVDADRRFVNKPDVDLNAFIYSPEGPVKKIANPSKLCESWKQIRATLITDYPGVTLMLLAKRFFMQFGLWASAERGAGLYEVQFAGADNFFDAGLVNARDHWYMVILWLSLILLAFVRGDPALRPVLIFLTIGALGHAFGIAFNNPFLACRYMFIHKGFIFLGGLISIPALFSSRRIRTI
jgi:hypothetical protein